MRDFKTNMRCVEFNKFAIDFVKSNYSAHILVMFKGNACDVDAKKVVKQLTDRAYTVWQELGEMEFLQDAGIIGEHKKGMRND